MTPDQFYALKHAWHCLCGGDLCFNSLEEMKDLERLDLIKITPPEPGETPDGAEYGYIMTNKGESIARGSGES